MTKKLNTYKIKTLKKTQIIYLSNQLYESELWRVVFTMFADVPSEVLKLFNSGVVGWIKNFRPGCIF